MAHRWQGFTTAVLVGSFVVALGAAGDRVGAQTESGSENPDAEEVESPESEVDAA